MSEETNRHDILELQTKVFDLKKRVEVLERSAKAAPKATGPVAPAPDRDLDSEWGNPVVRKDPPRWKGATRVGYRYSDCEAEYLLELASFCEWKAAKQDENNETDDKGRPRSFLPRKDAGRARGWARRVAAGIAPTERPTTTGVEDDEEIPF